MEFTGDVDTTEWTVVFSRPNAVPGPQAPFMPPLCPALELAKYVLIRADTSLVANVYHNVDAVKVLGNIVAETGMTSHYYNCETW